MTETEWLEVSDILIRYFPTLKDKDGIVMSLWHKKLKKWLKKDVIKAIEFYAVKDKKPSIAGIMELLNAWKSPKDIEQIQVFYDSAVMGYLHALRERFPGKTDDELIEIQVNSDRLRQYSIIVGGKYTVEQAMEQAQERIDEIEEFHNRFSDDELSVMRQALGIKSDSLYNRWLLWKVFGVVKHGTPYYYHVKRKVDLHCISDEPATREHWQLWEKARKIASQSTKPKLIDVEADQMEEIAPEPTTADTEETKLISDDDIPF